MRRVSGRASIAHRVMDLTMCVLALPVVIPVVAVSAVAIRLSDGGHAVHWSSRVGRNNRNFRMAKLRTMRLDTPDVPTHLLEDRDTWVTPVGSFLRKFSVDELPQVYNVLRGDMAIVGPRPALHSQHDLVELRAARGIERLRPGITGLAQISGRDELSIEEKVDFDTEYLELRSVIFDLRIIARSVVPVLSRKSVVG